MMRWLIHVSPGLSGTTRGKSSTLCGHHQRPQTGLEIIAASAASAANGQGTGIGCESDPDYLYTSRDFVDSEDSEDSEGPIKSAGAGRRSQSLVTSPPFDARSAQLLLCLKKQDPMFHLVRRVGDLPNGNCSAQLIALG